MGTARRPKRGGRRPSARPAPLFFPSGGRRAAGEPGTAPSTGRHVPSFSPLSALLGWDLRGRLTAPLSPSVGRHDVALSHRAPSGARGAWKGDAGGGPCVIGARPAGSPSRRGTTRPRTRTTRAGDDLPSASPLREPGQRRRGHRASPWVSGRRSPSTRPRRGALTALSPKLPPIDRSCD